MQPEAPVQPTKKKAAFEGKKYEDAVRACLLRAGLQVPATAGSTNGPDVTVALAGGGKVCIEVKSRRATEGGQRTLKPAEDRLVADGDVLWDGKLPSFLKGDASEETWKLEKASFPGLYFARPATAVGAFYREKGSAYIQIQGKGLYHTGEDVLKLGVPEFSATTRLRIRCKQFDKSPVPKAVMSSLVFSRKMVQPSTLDLETMSDAALTAAFGTLIL
jgi:hypothetical protein